MGDLEFVLSTWNRHPGLDPGSTFFRRCRQKGRRWMPDQVRHDGAGASVQTGRTLGRGGSAAHLRHPSEGRACFPREVPAEALRPRSVPQVPSRDHCWSGSGSCGFRSLPCGRSSVPWRVPSFSAFRLRIQVPCRTPTKRSFFGVLSRNLPPGGFRFRRTLEGKWVRLWLAPPPRASSFRLPGTSLRWASVRRLPPLSAGPWLGPSLRFRRVAPCHKGVSGRDFRFAPSAK